MATDAEYRALFALLDDPSSTVREAVDRRLEELGEEAIDPLRALSVEHEGLHRERIDEHADAIRVTLAIERMRSFDEQPDASFEDAVFAISRFEQPGVDVDAFRRMLDTMAEDVRILAGAHATPIELFVKLRSYLFSELAFLGNRQDYYNPDNSSITRVLETRRGIPITLSVLLMLVGRRLRLTLRGIGMPLHFLVRYEDDARTFYVDAFNGGAILTVDQCRSLLGTSGVRFESSMLEPVSPRDIVVRMWRNLFLAWEQAGDENETALVTSIIRVFDPDFKVNPASGDTDTDEGDDDDDE